MARKKAIKNRARVRTVYCLAVLDKSGREVWCRYTADLSAVEAHLRRYGRRGVATPFTVEVHES